MDRIAKGDLASRGLCPELYNLVGTLGWKGARASPWALGPVVEQAVTNTPRRCCIVDPGIQTRKRPEAKLQSRYEKEIFIGLKNAYRTRHAQEEKSISELASQYGTHPIQLHRWRNHVLENLPQLFADKDSTAAVKAEYEQQKIEELYTEIGRLSTQLAWLKKNGDGKTGTKGAGIFH